MLCHCQWLSFLSMHMLIWVQTWARAIPTFCHSAFHYHTPLPSYCLISTSALPLPLQLLIQWIFAAESNDGSPMNENTHIKMALQCSDIRRGFQKCNGIITFMRNEKNKGHLHVGPLVLAKWVTQVIFFQV